MNEQKFNKAVDVWRKVSKELNIEINAPYKLDGKDGSFDCVAMLPEFGSQNGIVLLLTFPPDFVTDSNVASTAEKCGLSYSYLNSEDYMEYNKDVILEALSDWGFFGELSKKPDCLED
jgi:hypothetical protein